MITKRFFRHPLVLATWLAVLCLCWPDQAAAELKVVATLADLGWIAEQVGGSEVSVSVLCEGHRDPHTLPAKPSLTRKLKQADLLLYNGMELEIGWLPLLVKAARNSRITAGGTGELDCSAALPAGVVLDVPGPEIDRSGGDLHPLGNPHYLVDPSLVVAVTKLVAERFAQLDPDHAADFQARAEAVASDLGPRIEAWKTQATGPASLKAIVYHQQWEYLLHWLGIEIIGTIENRPGISPSPRHVEDLIRLGNRQDEVIVIAATWDHIDGARHVADKIGCPLLVLPASSGADGVAGYGDLMDLLCGELARAAGGS